MMVNPDKNELAIFETLDPWLIPGKHEGDKPLLDASAPDDIKELYNKWINMI